MMWLPRWLRKAEPQVRGSRPFALSDDAYLAERKMLLDTEGEATKSLDQGMLTLSAGALVLSLTVVRELTPRAAWQGYLFFSWAAFGIAVCAILISFRFSQYAMRRQIEILDARQAAEEPDSPADERNPWEGPTEIANTVSIVSFMAGVTSLAWFSIVNFNK